MALVEHTARRADALGWPGFLNWLLVKPERCLQIVVWRFGAKKSKWPCFQEWRHLKEETPPSQTRRFFLRGATHEILGEASFCFASTPQLEESPEAKSVLSLLRSGECQFKCKGPQKAQGKRKGRACIPRSSPSILGDSDRYLLIRLISITQATNKRKTHYRNLNINHVPHQGREGYTKTCIQAKTLVPTPVFVPKGCSMCGSVYHAQGRALPKLHAQAGAIPK